MTADITRDHRRIQQPLGILKAEHTRAVVSKTLHLRLLRRGYQVPSMYKDDTGEAKIQGQEVAMFGVYKTESHRRIPGSLDILEAKNTKGLLKRGYQMFCTSKGDTGGAEVQGKEVRSMSKGVNRGAKVQCKEVLSRSKDDTGRAEIQGK